MIQIIKCSICGKTQEYDFNTDREIHLKAICGDCVESIKRIKNISEKKEAETNDVENRGGEDPRVSFGEFR